QAWAGGLSDVPAGDAIAAARARARELTSGAHDEIDAQLLLAADQFVVAGPTVVAGYPWFGDWSRDTMTSYEGLFLESGREDEGRAPLRRGGAGLSDGGRGRMADAGARESNDDDSTLWFLHAVGRHVERARDLDLGAAL